MTTYKQTRETKSELENFRIKLTELFVLTLSAVFVLLTFTKNLYLIIPSILIIVDILVVLLVLMIQANRDKGKIEFEEDGQTLKSKVDMLQLSYEFSFWEYSVLIISSIAIIVFGIVMLL